jgi:hypothetical protein
MVLDAMAGRRQPLGGVEDRRKLSKKGLEGSYPAARSGARPGYNLVGEGGGAVGKALEGACGPEPELSTGSTMAAVGPLLTAWRRRASPVEVETRRRPATSTMSW